MHISWDCCPQNALNVTFSFDITMCLRNAKQSFSLQFECPTCHKILQTKCGYSEHVRRHLGMYRFMCPYCQRGLSSSKEFKQHLTSHTKENYFCCDTCPATFRYHYELKKHKLMCDKVARNSNCSS